MGCFNPLDDVPHIRDTLHRLRNLFVPLKQLHRKETAALRRHNAGQALFNGSERLLHIGGKVMF